MAHARVHALALSRSGGAVRNPDANASTLLSTGCAHGTRSLARSAPGAPQDILGGGTEGKLCAAGT